MGNLDRMELLKGFTKEEPENPFNWYALALEYIEVDASKASTLFDLLLNDFSSYLPTYYTAAQFFAENNELEKAKKTFENGLILAENQQELKALKELKNAYQNFLFENDFD